VCSSEMDPCSVTFNFSLSFSLSLGRIVISEQENQSPWQQRDYKAFNSSVTMETVDFSATPAIQDTPVTSYLCSHSPGQVVPAGPTILEGYAFSGGGRSIVRVEISVDEGKTWTVATLKSDPAVSLQHLDSIPRVS